MKCNFCGKDLDMINSVYASRNCSVHKAKEYVCQKCEPAITYMPSSISAPDRVVNETSSRVFAIKKKYREAGVIGLLGATKFCVFDYTGEENE